MSILLVTIIEHSLFQCVNDLHDQFPLRIRQFKVRKIFGNALQHLHKMEAIRILRATTASPQTTLNAPAKEFQVAAGIVVHFTAHQFSLSGIAEPFLSTEGIRSHSEQQRIEQRCRLSCKHHAFHKYRQERATGSQPGSRETLRVGRACPSGRSASERPGTVRAEQWSDGSFELTYA